MSANPRETWVVKLGSSLVTEGGMGLAPEYIRAKVRELAELRAAGICAVLVSSGSVAEGIARMRWKQRPTVMRELQAAAAIGQAGLVQTYETAFREFGIHAAQVLLTHEDIADRQRYLNARSAIDCLLELGVVPIVNENDTVATDEIRLGDNDTLAGLVANLVEAGLLVLLTDRPGLLEHEPGGALIPAADAGDPALERYAGGSSYLGRGGMRTKLKAAAIAARSGTDTVIADGNVPGVLAGLASGAAHGTRLKATRPRLTARKRWLAGLAHTPGKLVLDAGAVRSIREQGGSLLAAGVTAVEGRFHRGDVVALAGPEGTAFAHGLVNYGAGEVQRLQGRASSAISTVLGYAYEPELVHRDNLILLD